MMYGELAEKSYDYQSGHSTGSLRAFDDAIMCFTLLELREGKKKYSNKQIIEILESCKWHWIKYCDTYGMGLNPEEEDN